MVKRKSYRCPKKEKKNKGKLKMMICYYFFSHRQGLLLFGLYFLVQS
jgi:hypothetical protein